MKKTIIQFLLIAIILVCFFIFKQKYLNKNKTTIIEETKVLDTKNNEINNLVKSLIYTSKDIKGNQYTIKSKNATYSDFDTDQIIMTDVIATLNLVDSDDINIFAKKAFYNPINYHTSFSGGVTIIHSVHNFYSDNLDLSFEKKVASIFKNITYKNLDTTILADNIELDLITKDSKISMVKESDNIKIINLK